MAQQDSEAEEKRRQFDCNSTYAAKVSRIVACLLPLSAPTALSPCLAVEANLRDQET